MNILKEFHGEPDCIFGKLLKGVGRKFNPKKYFVSIIGPASCWVEKECSQEEKSKVFLDSEICSWRLHGQFGDSFHKKPRLIGEPVEGYEGLDYKGSNKHDFKAYGHTPGTEFKINAEHICSICYLDIDRKKRRPEVTLVKVQINPEIKKVV